MDDSDRDKLIIETANDVRWIKSWCADHRATHAKYVFYFIGTAIALIIALVK